MAEQMGHFRITVGLCSFVPWQYVHLTWQALKAEVPQNIIRLDDFISYFESTWLVGSYPPSLWNVFETKSARTNNHIEGWDSKLKKVVRKHNYF